MTKNRITNAAVVCSLIAACGMPMATAIAGPSPIKSTATTSDSQKLDLAHNALALQPGDQALMSNALSNPLRFTSRQNTQEFTGELIVHAKEAKVHTAQSRIAPAIVKSSAFVDEYVVRVPAGLSEGELAAMLMSTGDYEFVEPNWKLFPLLIPNDSQYGSSWQHTRLQSANAWNLHTGDSDIIVAVCDSGVRTSHADLQAALVPGYNAVNNDAQVDGGQVEDVNGHGTFVSGLAAAQGNNGTGVVGVGWDFRIMPIRVSNNSSGTANGFDLLEGARWAVDHGASAINVSFSGGSSSGNQATAKYVIDRGGLLFWSSGNDNTFVGYDSPDLVIVGSTTSSDNRSSFSNYGTAVDLVAPGSSVRSTRINGGYGNGSGTSYASPIATGVAAMIFSVRSDLSGQDVQDILYQSVDDLGAAGRDDFFGRGRVNTFNAMQVALAYEPRLGLPLVESFDSASWMDHFNSTSGSPSTAVDAESSGSGSVLVLDSSDQVTTVPMGGRTLASVLPTLSYRFKVDGAESGEGFRIDISRADGSWMNILDYTAVGTNTDGYIPVAMTLPPDFMWHGVELRMAADTSDSSDKFMIDDVIIDNITATPEAPLVDSFESGVLSGLIWDDIDGPSVQVDNATHAAAFTGEQSIESIDIPMAQFGITPGYVRLDAWAGPSAGADDTMLVEVFNISNSWVTVGSFDGSALSETPAAYEFETPLTAWAIDTLRVRLTSAGNDPIFIDNVYVGPDQISSGCSGADFAEPFGELDFFDVSAFLIAFNAGDLAADLSNDGTLDFFDVSQFLTIFGQGCP